MQSIARAWVVLVLVFAIVAAPGVAWAHATLHGSDPAAGSTVATAPRQLHLRFNEALEPAFASVRLTGPDGKDIATGKALVDKADPKTVVLPLPPLAAGAYKARWSVVGHDGHRIKGEVGFTVKP